MKRLNNLGDWMLVRVLTAGTAAADWCENVVERQHRRCSNGCYQACSRTCRVCVVAPKTCGSWSCGGCGLCP